MHSAMRNLRRNWRGLSFEKKLAIIVGPVLVALVVGVLVPVINRTITPDKPPPVLRARLTNVHVETDVTLATYTAHHKTIATTPGESMERRPRLAVLTFVRVAARGSTVRDVAQTATPGASLLEDGDGDGVPDAQDACPNEPAATTNGCAPEDEDGDGDGVPDAQDACPEKPAATKNGCAAIAPEDGDGDGVPDARDKCPKESAATDNGCKLPPTVTILVDKFDSGCPDSAVFEAMQGTAESCAAVAAVAGTSVAAGAKARAHETLVALRATRSRGGSDGRRQPVGVAVSYEVNLEGFKGRRVDVTWSLRQKRGGAQVPLSWLVNHRVARLEGTAPDDSGSDEFWVPLPKRHGPFYVRISVVDRNGTTLTYKNSTSFG